MNYYSIANHKTLATGDAAAVQSAAITANTIDILSGGYGHFVAIGADPTATNESFFIPAGQCLSFSILSGQKVSALSQNGDSFLTIAY